MNDEQTFLANAYLDGELTVDERRIAEADPEVMTEVEQLRALQSALRDTPPPSVEARESAISAAMATFGEIAAGEIAATGAPIVEAEPTKAPVVVPFRPRPAYAKFLGVAAAVVAVAGLGIIVSQAGRGSDDSATDMADTAAEASVERNSALTESVDAAEITAEAAEAGDDGGAELAADDEMAGDGDEGAAEPAADDSADMETMDTADSGDAPQADEAAYRTVPVDFDPEAAIADDAELGVYGVYLLRERDGGVLPSTPNHSCLDAEQVLDEATLLLDDEPVPVYIDVREADGLVVALRTDTCSELVVGSLLAD